MLITLFNTVEKGFFVCGFGAPFPNNSVHQHTASDGDGFGPRVINGQKRRGVVYTFTLMIETFLEKAASTYAVFGMFDSEVLSFPLRSA